MTAPRLTPTIARPTPPPLPKIAFEEHFLVPEAMKKNPDGSIDETDVDFRGINGLDPRWFRQVYERLMDFDHTRIESMDENNIDYAILSLMGPGIGAATDARHAQDLARACNDALAEKISQRPDRYGGFACLAIHDPEVAVKELERCVTELGFKGVLFNGFSQVDLDDNLMYLDEDRCTPIWEALEALDVPLYLQPRPSYQQMMYKDHRELICANWGYACETGTHVVQILVGGVLDRFPKAKLILGHLGENLPFSAWRLQHWMEFNPGHDRPQRRIQDYLADNVYVTISGNFSVPALMCTLQVMGSDRVLFSVDHPFENMDEASAFLDNAPISEADRVKIAHANARELFKLPHPSANSLNANRVIDDALWAAS